MSLVNSRSSIQTTGKYLKLTASSPLKIDGWKTSLVSFWVSANFQGRTVRVRECIGGLGHGGLG